MKHEFEEKVNAIDCNKKFTQEQYEIIERVYTFYPGISNKDEVVEMFVKYGMIIFNDLLPRAQAFADIQDEIIQNKKALEIIKNREKKLYS
jgi:hypothetical protein